jgi:hypothetical protein
MAQYEDITYDPSESSSGATSETLTATVPLFASGPMQPGMKWHVCPTCGWAFPEAEMVRRKGAWYCAEDGEDWLEADSRIRR